MILIKVDKLKEERLIIVRNKIAEIISLISIESNSEKKEYVWKTIWRIIKGT